MSLRASVLLSKFVLTLFLARELALEDFGLWVLIVAGVGYGTFLVGAEMYNITLRSLIKDSSRNIGGLSKQWLFFWVAYLTILSLAFGLDTFYKVLSPWFFFTCSTLLILEHCTQEIHRIAIYYDNQIHANMLLFIKTVGWILPTITYFLITNSQVHLSRILYAWLFGGALSLVYGVCAYWYLFKELHIVAIRLNKKKIIYYVKALTPFWVLALAIKTPLVLDRYFLEILSDREQLSVYGYYIAFGNGIQAMFDAVVVAKLIPQLLNNNAHHRPAFVVGLVKKYVVYSLCFWFVSFLLIYFAIPYFNQLTGKHELDDNRILFVCIIIGHVIFSLSVLIQYGLYSLHRDSELINGAMSYLVICVVSFFIFIPIYGSFGAALAMGISALFMLMTRFTQLLRVYYG